MTYRTMMEGDTCVLQVRGELDAVSVPEIREALEAVVAAGYPRVVLDSSELRLIDSSGVGAIVSIFKRVRARGGVFSVRGLKEQPLAIFHLLNLDRVLVPQAAVAA